MPTSAVSVAAPAQTAKPLHMQAVRYMHARGEQIPSVRSGPAPGERGQDD
jgi:hypothetical protein